MLEQLQMEEKDAAIQLHIQRVGEEEQRDRRPIGAACFAALFVSVRCVLRRDKACEAAVYVVKLKAGDDKND